MNYSYLWVIVATVVLAACNPTPQKEYFHRRLPAPYLRNSDYIIDQQDLVYLDTNFVLRKLDIAEGKEIFKVDIGVNLEFSWLFMQEGALFLGGNATRGYRFWLVDPQSGEIRDSNLFAGTRIHFKPISYGGNLIFVSALGKIISYNLAKREQERPSHWFYRNNIAYANNITLYEGKLYTTLRGSLMAFDWAGKKILDSIPIGINFQGAILENILCGDNLIIPSDKKVLVYALKERKVIFEHDFFNDGQEPWDYLCGTNKSGDRVFFKTLGGHIFCWDNPKGSFQEFAWGHEYVPLLCGPTFGAYGDFLFTFDGPMLHVYNYKSQEEILSLKEAQGSPVQFIHGHIVFINADNELCKIPLP